MSSLIHYAPSITHRKPLSCERVRVNWDHPLNKGLVAWWIFPGQSTAAVDIVNGIRAIPSSAIPNVGSTKGNVLSLTGSPYMVVPDVECLDLPGTDLTITALIKTSTASGHIVGGYNNSPYPGYSLAIGISVSGALHFWNGVGWTGGDVRVDDGNWNHVGVSVKGAAGSALIQFALNGSSAGGSGSGSPPTSYRGERALFGRAKDGDNPFTGLCAFIAIYRGRAFTLPEFALDANYPYGTPSNPRLLVEPRSTWFTLSQAQGAYHRYPTINY